MGKSVGPLFSIITPTLNAGETVARTVASVMVQEGQFGRVEHIIMDAGSTDGTLELLRQYEHLTVISEQDKGIYDGMNRGIARASGQYIAILNADDTYEPYTLSLVKAAFEADPEVGLVHGDMNVVDGEKVIKRWVPKPWKRVYGMWVAHPTCVVRRDIYEKYGTFDLRYKQQADYDLIVRLGQAGVKFTYISKVLTNFLVGGESTREWNFHDSVEIRRKDRLPWLWAVLTSLINRYYFMLRLRLKDSRKS